MARPLLLFAHGAGLGKDSPWMERWARGLADLGEVVRFDYPYMAAGRKMPDRLPKLLAHHRAVLLDALQDRPATPVVLIGKSMGSRVGCHLATEPDLRDLVQAVVCLGYPLVSSGKARTLRDEVLRELSRPILFVQGTRDRLCPLETLEEVRREMQAPSELFVVDGGDHSLHLGKRDLASRGLTREQVDRQAITAIKAFLDRQLPTS